MEKLTRVNSTTVSLTDWELERLRNLYSTAWGSYEDKTVAKLEKAMERVKVQQDNARKYYTQKVRERKEEEGNVGP